MIRDTWNITLMDFDKDNPEDVILAVMDENPRRDGRIRNDITTIRTVPVEINNTQIQWWGITEEDSLSLQIFPFRDDETMSDYNAGRDAGWYQGSLIYKDRSDDHPGFDFGLEKLREYIHLRLNGETVD